MSSGEPGVPNVPQVKVEVSRITALSPESQGLLAGAVRSPEQAAIIQQANEARGLLVQDPPRPLRTVSSLTELFGNKSTKSAEAVTPRAQAEKRDASIVSRSGNESLAIFDGDQASAEGVRQAQIIIAGEVARKIIETRSLSGRDISNISGQVEALKSLFQEMTGFTIDDPNLIVALANSELGKKDQVFEALVRRYNEIQSREIPPDTKEAQEIVDRVARANSEAAARQSTARAEETRLAERRASLLPEPGRDGELRDKLAALEARGLDGELKLAKRLLDKAENEWLSRAESGADPVQVQAAKAEFEAKTAAYGQLQKDIVTRNKLAEERDGGLDSAIAKNKSNREQADNDVATAEAALKQAQANLKAIRDNRLGFETEYARDLVELLPAAIAEVNDAEQEVINNRLVEEAQKSGSEMDKFMTARVKAAYHRTIPKGFLITEKTGRFGFGRRTKTEEVIPDVFKAREDVVFHLLSANGKGPAKILERELLRAYNGNQAEVNKLMSDHDFVVKWSTELAFNAINMHLLNR